GEAEIPRQLSARRTRQEASAGVPQGPALPISARRHAAFSLQRTRAACRRNGTRQDGTGDCRLRASPPNAENRACTGGFAGLAESGMGGTDRQVHRLARANNMGPASGASQVIPRAVVLLSRQLRTST